MHPVCMICARMVSYTMMGIISSTAKFCGGFNKKDRRPTAQCSPAKIKEPGTFFFNHQ